MGKTKKLTKLLSTIVKNIIVESKEQDVNVEHLQPGCIDSLKEYFQSLSQTETKQELEKWSEYFYHLASNMSRFSIVEIIQSIMDSEEFAEFKVFGVVYGNYKPKVLETLTEYNCEQLGFTTDSSEYIIPLMFLNDIVCRMLEIKTFKAYNARADSLTITQFKPKLYKPSYILTKKVYKQLAKLDEKACIYVDMKKSISFDLIPLVEVHKDIESKILTNRKNLEHFEGEALKNAKSSVNITKIYNNELDHLESLLALGVEIYKDHLDFLENTWKARFAMSDRILKHYQYDAKQLPEMLFHYDLISELGRLEDFKEIEYLIGKSNLFTIVSVAKWATEYEIINIITGKDRTKLAKRIRENQKKYISIVQIKEALRDNKQEILYFMRKPTRKKTILLDVAKPITPEMLEKASLPDCFGVEFEVKDPKCHKCHDRESCSTIFGNTAVKTKAKKIIEDTGNIPLDEIDFTAIEEKKEKLINLLKKRSVTIPMSVEELFKWFTKTSKCSDTVSVAEYFKTFITENGFKTVNKQILIKD